MAFTYVGQVAANQNKTAGTSLTANPTGTIPVGSLLIVEAVADNTGTANQNSGSTELSFTDSAGNTYTKVREVLRGAGAAAAGVTTALWWCITTVQLTTSSTFTLSFTSRTAKAFRVHRFSFEGTVTAQGDNGANGASTTPSVAVSGLTSGREYLFWGTVGYEGPTTASFTKDADYTDPTALVYGTSGGTANTNVCVVSGYRIATLTTDTYNPTLGTSSDWGAILLALWDNVTPPASAPGNFQATAADAYLDLSWQAVTGASRYEVAIGPSASPTNWFNVGNVTSYRVGGLLNGTLYYVRVRAANNAGAGPATSDLERTPANSSGYSQLDADAGWRFPGNTLNQNNSQGNRAWSGNPSGYTRAVRGIFQNLGAYPEVYLALPSAPTRMRYQVRDGAILSGNDLSFFFRSVLAQYSDNTWWVQWLSGGGLELWERVNWSAYQRATGTNTPRTANSTYLVEIRDNGSTIEVYINGSLRLTHNSTSGAGRANAGFSLYTDNAVSIDWLSYDSTSYNFKTLALSTGGTATPAFSLNRSRGMALSVQSAATPTLALGRSRGMAISVAAVTQPGFEARLTRALQWTVAATATIQLPMQRITRMGLDMAATSAVSLQAARTRALGVSATVTSTLEVTPRRHRNLALPVTATGQLTAGMGAVRRAAWSVSATGTLGLQVNRHRNLTLAMPVAGAMTLPLQAIRSLALEASAAAALQANLNRHRNLTLDAVATGQLVAGMGVVRTMALAVDAAAALQANLNRHRNLTLSIPATGTLTLEAQRHRGLAWAAHATGAVQLPLARVRGLAAAWVAQATATYTLTLTGGQTVTLRLEVSAQGDLALAMQRNRAMQLDLMGLSAVAMTPQRYRSLELTLVGSNVQTLELRRVRGLAWAVGVATTPLLALSRHRNLTMPAVGTALVQLVPGRRRALALDASAAAAMTLSLRMGELRGYVQVRDVALGQAAVWSTATVSVPIETLGVIATTRTVALGAVEVGVMVAAILEADEV